MMRPLFSRQHTTQSRKSAVHIAEVVHVRDTTEFRRLHLFDRRKDGDHGIVDPDINRTQARFKRGGRCFHCFGIADICRIGGSTSSPPLHILSRSFQCRQIARDEPDARSNFSEFKGNGSTKPRRRACDNDSDRLPHRIAASTQDFLPA